MRDRMAWVVLAAPALLLAWATAVGAGPDHAGDGAGRPPPTTTGPPAGVEVTAGCPTGQDGECRELAAGPQRFTSITSGERHACGLAEDGSAACWGNNGSGQAEAPEGRFTQLAAGAWFTCGLRVGGSVECWGSFGYRGSGPPAGRFTALSAGPYTACGLRVDGTVACWGQDAAGKVETSAPPFVEVQAGLGVGYSCGLHDGGTVACWSPDSTYGSVIDPPSDRLVWLSVGSGFACGLRTGMTVACWGDNYRGQLDAPGGRFLAVASGRWDACAIRAGRSLWMRTDRSVACWGENFRTSAEVWEREGPFASVVVGEEHACGLLATGAVECWGKGPAGMAPAPGGRFTAMSVGSEHSCGLRTDGTVACWPLTDDPVDDRFAALSAGGSHMCGLRSDGTVTCWGDAWGDTWIDMAADPDGRFTALSTGGAHSCGLRTDGTLACWHGGELDTPFGRFVDVSAGGYRRACAVRASGRVICWTGDPDDPPYLPDGRFTAVSAGSEFACGLRTGGAIRCWNEWGLPGPAAPNGAFSAVSVGGSPCLRAPYRRHHLLLGREPARGGEPSAGPVQHRIGRWRSFLRTGIRGPCSLLGQRCSRPEHPARGSVDHSDLARELLVRPARRRDLRLLGAPPDDTASARRGTGRRNLRVSSHSKSPRRVLLTINRHCSAPLLVSRIFVSATSWSSGCHDRREVLS